MAVGTVLVAMMPFYKRIIFFMYKIAIEPIGKFFSTFATLPDRLTSLEAKMGATDEIKIRLENLEEVNKEIKKELTPNGGLSMKDVVVSLATTVKRIETATSIMTSQASRMEARQHSLLNTIEIPTFETNAAGECVFANKAYLELINRTADEVKGFGWVNIIHPDDRAKVRNEWDAAIRDNRNFELAYRVVCKGRVTYDVYCAAEPIAGSANGYVGNLSLVAKSKTS